MDRVGVDRIRADRRMRRLLPLEHRDPSGGARLAPRPSRSGARAARPAAAARRLTAGRLPDDRRPRQQPDHHRQPEQAGLCGASRRRATSRPVSSSPDPTTRSCPPIDAASSPTRSSRTPSQLISLSRATADPVGVRPPRRSGERPPVPRPPRRRLPVDRRTDPGRGHHQLPRPMARPGQEDRALDRHRRRLHSRSSPCSCLQPNGDTPLPDGGVLVTEIGGWIDRFTPHRPARVVDQGADRLPVRCTAASGRQRPRGRLQHAGTDRRHHPAREDRLDVRAELWARGAGPAVARGHAPERDDRRDRRLAPPRGPDRPGPPSGSCGSTATTAIRASPPGSCASPTAWIWSSRSNVQAADRPPLAPEHGPVGDPQRLVGVELDRAPDDHAGAERDVPLDHQPLGFA